MIGSNVYNYVNVLDKALDASWIRNEAISNNIANADTPGYKRQDVDFETQLQRAVGDFRYTSMDQKIAGVNKELNQLKPRAYTDYAGFSYRLDGNNVDPDTENVTLASNQLKYNALMQSMNQEFSNMKSAMK